MTTQVTVRMITLLCSAALLGCAASPTERDFGDSVRHTIAQQRIAPQPAPETPQGTDGQRLESVMSVYRSMVGDPLPVVREVLVEKAQ